ncbi:MAG: DUF2281 domain-containing protein [Microcystis aeruginosa G13-03]|nr:DUF2281 domain-containing protein [Microcystis aeruginosa G13-03]
MNNADLDTNSPLLQTLQTLPVQQQQEIAGLYQGQGWISDDFNEPLTDELLPPT